MHHEILPLNLSVETEVVVFDSPLAGLTKSNADYTIVVEDTNVGFSNYIRRFKVHKRMLDGIKFFEDSPKDNISGTIEIADPDDRADDIHRLLNFVYRREYDFYDYRVRCLYDSADWKSIETHIRMYKLGRKYTVHGLAEIALQRAKYLHSNHREDRFVDQPDCFNWIWMLYDGTSDDDIFRRYVATWVMGDLAEKKESGSLDKSVEPLFDKLCHNVPEFTHDLIWMQADLLGMFLKKARGGQSYNES